MYDVPHTLEQGARHAVPFLALVAVAIVATIFWFVHSLREGRLARLYAISPALMFWYLAHDVSLLLGFRIAPEASGHWVMTAAQFAAAPFIVLELLALGQVIRYGRKELAPHLSQPTFTTLIVGGAILTGAGWVIFKEAVDDGLYLVGIGLQLGAAPLAAVGVLWRRRSRQGLSAPGWAALAFSNICFCAALFFLGGPFLSPIWLLFSLANVGGAVTAALLVHRAPHISTMSSQSQTAHQPVDR